MYDGALNSYQSRNDEQKFQKRQTSCNTISLTISCVTYSLCACVPRTHEYNSYSNLFFSRKTKPVPAKLFYSCIDGAGATFRQHLDSTIVTVI